MSPSEKFFWFSPYDEFNNQPARLWYVDSYGTAMQEVDPQYGNHSVAKLLEQGYVEISWMSARAMGAPV